MATTKKPATKKPNETENKPVRRKRRKKPQSLLSEAINPARAKRSLTYIVSGAVGYFGASSLIKLLSDKKPVERAAIIGGVAFITGNYMGLPAVSAGMAAAMVQQLIDQNKSMSEPANYVNPEMLSENKLKALPPVLDGNGQPVQLSALNEGTNLYNGIPFEELPSNIY